MFFSEDGSTGRYFELNSHVKDIFVSALFVKRCVFLAEKINAQILVQLEKSVRASGFSTKTFGLARNSNPRSRASSQAPSPDRETCVEPQAKRDYFLAYK